MEPEILQMIPAPGWQVVWAGGVSHHYVEPLVAWALVKYQDEEREVIIGIRGVHLEEGRFPELVHESDWSFLGYQHQDMKPSLDWLSLGKAACEQHMRESKPPLSSLKEKA